MKLIKVWQGKLERVNKSIQDYNNILERDDITKDIKMFCLKEIEIKTKYKELIEETIDQLLSINIPEWKSVK